MCTDGTLNWILSDHLGSTAVTAHADGSWRGEIAYTPFGETRSSLGTTPTDYRFTGQRLEAELGLYFYQARWYDPALGVFTQADTIIPNPGNPLDMNRYSYVINNPLRFTDPSGHEICLDNGDCYENGKYTRTIKTVETHPYEFFLNEIYQWPVHGVSDNRLLFGQYRGVYEWTGHQIFHPGLDIGTELGTDIYACAPGKVVYTGYNNDFGYTVIIEHKVPYGSNIYSIYAHLGTKEKALNEVIFVEYNQEVGSYTHIGEMGNTKGPKKERGAVTSPHLHFEIRTSLNVDLSQIADRGYPLQGKLWWMNQDGGKNCSPWTNCWLDLGMLYGYDPSYDPNVANGQ